MQNKTLSDRMKEYESVNKSYLMRKTPVIIRLDGCAFHTYTKNFEKPFDVNLVELMSATMKFLVDNIQGAQFGYTQSDEISILLRDWDTPTTDAWYAYNVQKLVSVAASYATGYFNHIAHRLNNKLPIVCFDARVHNLPYNEVTNYFIWRQQDCTRNSIRAYALNKLGQTRCQNLSNEDALIEMSSNGFDWHEEPIYFKRGVTYSKGSTDIDDSTPLFVDCREYVERHLHVEEIYPEI